MLDRSCQELIGSMHRQRRNDEYRSSGLVFRLQQTKNGLCTEDGALHLVSERSDKVYLRLKTVDVGEPCDGSPMRIPRSRALAWAELGGCGL